MQIDVILLQKKRLKDLKETVDKGNEVIHPFTEIVDNLQALCPEKFIEIADMLNALNDKAIQYILNVQENYNK